MEQIQLGKQDIIFAGGGEEEHWSLAMMFDGMGALSTKFNDTPEKASRPYDVDRDGFVIAGGGGSAKGELPGPECAGVDGAALTTSSLTTVSPLDADTVKGFGGGGGGGTL